MDNVLVNVSFIQELLRAKEKVLKAASERGLLQKALLRPSNPPGAQVTGPYPNTDNQYAAECGPLTKEQIEQVRVKLTSVHILSGFLKEKFHRVFLSFFFSFPFFFLGGGGLNLPSFSLSTLLIEELL